MYSKVQIEQLYEKIADAINISEEMFDSAEAEYKKLGKWISENTPKYDIQIYPQGSFALGTVIKPYNKDDEYDIDLVCEYQQEYGFTAKQLKTQEVRSILDTYGRAKAIIEKRRCWQVTYEHDVRFHLDVVPAILRSKYISITDHNEDKDKYEYIGSNPKGYIEWFKHKQLAQYTAIKSNILAERRKSGVVFRADIEPVKEYNIRTPLQKTIQILKCHRDILFADDNSNVKPVSIIITTIAIELYQNEITIYDTLTSILKKSKEYIESQKQGDTYYLYNPVYTGVKKENFADKWNEHHERAEAFFDWLEAARHDLVDSVANAQDDSEIASILEFALGKRVSKAVFSSNTQVLNEAEIRQSETSVVPYKVQQILSAPQRQKPTFSCPNGYRVFITAKVTDRNNKTFPYKNDGSPIPKNASINFYANFGGIKRPFTIKWQVVNTGYEAQSIGQLRGEFTTETQNKTTHSESTLYQGIHSIQCFVIQRGRCVAKSPIFIVNIM